MMVFDYVTSSPLMGAIDITLLHEFARRRRWRKDVVLYARGSERGWHYLPEHEVPEACLRGENVRLVCA